MNAWLTGSSPTPPELPAWIDGVEEDAHLVFPIYIPSTEDCAIDEGWNGDCFVTLLPVTWGHIVLHYVTIIIFHNTENVLNFEGMDHMHYYNFYCTYADGGTPY